MIAALLTFQLGAQEDKKDWGIRFSGFVKNDITYDTRQTVNAREGHFLLYPANESLDIEGTDINAQPEFNMLAIQTRLKGSITAPDALGAKMSGAIEGAFFGHSNADVNGFRLRHAFWKAKWENTELLAGQYWHPMFVTGAYPGTVSFNTGVPFQPFSRNPQVRLTHMFGSIGLMGAVVTQRDFTSIGPKGGSSTYLRNSGMPMFQGRVFYTSKDDAGNELLAGLGGGYKLLRPRLESVISDDTTYAVDELTGSYQSYAFVKVKREDFTLKTQFTYGQDMTDLLMIGGFGAFEVDDVIKEQYNYTPISTYSFWVDAHTNGETWQFGLFGGYSGNMGTGEESILFAYGRGSNIASLYRISPRVIYNMGKFRLACEIEHTNAEYGSPNYDDKMKVEGTDNIANTRILLAGYLFF